MPSILARSLSNVVGPTNLSQWNSKQNDSAANVNAATVVLKIRNHLRQSGAVGFVSFLQTLKQRGRPAQAVTKSQLKKAFAAQNLHLSDVEIRAIALFLGEDTAIPITTLRDLIFGKLDGYRLELATRAFNQMDSQFQRGYLAVDDVLRNHDAQLHPDVLFENHSSVQVHAAFVKAFTALVPPPSLVNLTQWLEYCQCLSAATEKDDYFELIFARAWHVAVDTTGCPPAAPTNFAPTASRSSFTLLDNLHTKNLLETAMDYKSQPSLDHQPADAPFRPPLSFTTAVDAEQTATTPARKTSRNATLDSAQTAECMTHMYVDKNSVLPRPKEISVGTKMILSRLRESLKSRGAVGIVGLSRKFRIMDDDNNGSISLVEFKKAMRECNVECSEADMRLLFDAFDTDESQSIDFKEFLNGVREPMNDRRLRLVHEAFAKIDRNGDGVLEPSDIVGCYTASKHPDVIAGKRTEDEIFREFLDTFDVDVKDGKVTRDEWEHYYHNISCVIDSDDYFELMMRNAWQLSGGTGWSASSFEHNKTRGLALDDDDRPPVVFTTPRRYGNASEGLTSCLQGDNAPPRSSSSVVPPDMQHPKELRRIVKRLKTTLKSRGMRGFTGFHRCLTSMDTNGSGMLDLARFRMAMERCQVNLNAGDSSALFDNFDADGQGTIHVSKLIQGIRDPMNDRRLLVVHLAFDLLDKTKSHVLAVDDIVSTYDARKHPEVLAGRKTDREVFAEFLETLESNARAHENQLTLVEWIEYHANISAAIDDDDYFELMMRNAWHIPTSSTQQPQQQQRNQGTTQDDLRVRRYEQNQQLLGRQGFGSAATTAKLSFYDVLDHSVRPVAQKNRPRLHNNSSTGAADCLAMSQPRGGPKAAAPTTARRLKKGLSGDVDVPIATVGVQPILGKLRDQLKAQQHGFIGLSRAFKLMDADHNGHLSMTEFKQAMAGFGIGAVDARILFNYFDVDHSGSVEIQEFITGLRDPMNERRLGFVRAAFALMDKDGNGLVEPSDIVEAYDATKHPDVIAGRKTPDQVFREFLDTFDVDGHHDAKITPTMWEHYYANISASIPDDDYFELMMRNAWHISGGHGWCANTSNRRVLVNESHVVEIENDLGVRGPDAVQKRLETQIKSYMNQPGTIKTLNSVNVTACLNHTSERPTPSAPSSRLASAAKIVPLQAMHSVEMAAAPPPRRPSLTIPNMDGLWGALRHLLQSKGLLTIVQCRRAIFAHDKFIAATQVQAALQTAGGINLTLDMTQKLVDDVRSRFPMRSDDVSSSRVATSALWESLAMPKEVQLVKMAKRIFAHLQVEAKGECTPLVLAKAFDAPSHPMVLLGLVSADDVFKDFAQCFDVDASGFITYEALEKYCSDLFLSTGELPQCLRMLRDCFHVEIPA
ncbi:hypothetical protein AeNC1_002785 [Aphanomyces euteiches]|nr:hypothetical protein AeNC1_002785 [Aphanomyces euteiches]